jgi:hypothetical protein
MNRRTFLHRLAAVPAMAWLAPKVEASTPAILGTRPEQIGIRNASYWAAQDGTFPYAGLSIAGFLAGQELKCMTFEVDAAAGWVGLFEHEYIDARLSLKQGPGGGPMPYWVKGPITFDKRMPARADVSKILRDIRDGQDSLLISLRDLAAE